MKIKKVELLLALFRAAMTRPEDAPIELLTQEQLQALYPLAKMHDLVHLIGFVLERLGMTQTPIEQEYIRMYMLAVCRYERLRYDAEQIYACLCQGGIRYLPLKGAVIRDYYPAPWMRTSTDLDILIQKEDLDAASRMLTEELGFTLADASDHDVSFLAHDGMHVELHFSLIEDGVVGRADEPLKRVWDYTVPSQAAYNPMVLCPEMLYYYHVAHMAKHYVRGGCGIRSVLDLWVLRRHITFDEKKCQELLAQGGLTTFESYVCRLSRAWFEQQAHDVVTLQMERFLFAGGVFGTYVNRTALGQVKEGGKVSYALSRIWLPYRELCALYPSLQGRRFLLPVYQIWRWIRLIFLGGLGRFNASVSEQKRTAMEKMLRALEL